MLYLNRIVFICFGFLITLSAQAEMYKWVDENGQVHYSQQRPLDKQATKINAPPPPAVKPADANKELGNLLKQQQDELSAKQRLEDKMAREQKQQQAQQKNCELAQQNLTRIQNNPGRKVRHADGTVTRPTDEQYQELLKKFQDKVKKYCK